MATISIKDILGTDNVSASRLTQNSNFKILADGVNKLETFLNTTPAGGELKIRNIKLLQGSNPLTYIGFECETSAKVNGNLTVAGLLSSTGNISTSGALSATGNTTLGIPAATTIGTTEFVIATDKNKIVRGIDVDERVLSTGIKINDPSTVGVASVVYDANLNATTIDPAGLRYLNIDLSSYDSTQVGVKDISKIVLKQGLPGQRLSVKVVAVNTTSALGVTDIPNSVKICTIPSGSSVTNFNQSYFMGTNASDIIIPADLGGVGSSEYVAPANANTTVVQTPILPIDYQYNYYRQYVNLIYKTTGWEVESAHPSVIGV